MEFSKEINQTKPFASESVKAMLNTLYTANALQDRSVRLLKPYQINDQHYNILRILKGRRGEPATPGEIKAVLINSRGDLTRLIDKLVKMELVNRKQSDADRRGVHVIITDKGLELIRRIDAEFKAAQVYEFNLTDAEAEQLNKLLDKLRGNTAQKKNI